MTREALAERIEFWKTCPYKYEPQHATTPPSEYVDVRDHLETFRSVAVGNVMEIGVDVGHSTAAFLLGLMENDAPDGRLYSVDIREVPAFDTYKHCQQWKWLRANSATERGRILAAFSLPQSPSLNVLYIDGDHSYEGCKADLDNFGPLVLPGGVILIHDVMHTEFLGVRRAMSTYRLENKIKWATVEGGSWGLGILHV